MSWLQRGPSGPASASRSTRPGQAAVRCGRNHTVGDAWQGHNPAIQASTARRPAHRSKSRQASQLPLPLPRSPCEQAGSSRFAQAVRSSAPGRPSRRRRLGLLAPAQGPGDPRLVRRDVDVLNLRTSWPAGHDGTPAVAWGHLFVVDALGGGILVIVQGSPNTDRVAAAPFGKVIDGVALKRPDHRASVVEDRVQPSTYCPSSPSCAPGRR